MSPSRNPCLLGLLLGVGCTSIDPPAPEADLSGREAFIARRAERVRGLPFPADVALVLQDREEFQADLRASQPEDEDDELDPVEEVLKAFGFMEDDADAEGHMEDLLGEAIQGLYEPDERRLVVVLDEHDQSKEGTFSHEVVHAIDDGRFDLEAMLEIGDDVDLDRWLARRAVVEGCATLHQLDYLLLRSGFDTSASGPQLSLWSRHSDVLEGKAASLVAGTGIERDAAVAEAPAVLIDLIIMPYVAGARMLNHVKLREGVAGVDRVFREPPESTEQVLDPTRYYEELDPPVTLTLPEVDASTPGASAAAPLEGTLGDYLIRVLLRDDEGELWPGNVFAETGWEGDRFIVRPDGARRVLLWRTEWESARHADAFAERMEEWLEDRARAEGGAPADDGLAGPVRGPFEGGGTWVAGDGARGLVTRDGRSVHVALAIREDERAGALAWLRRASVDDPGAVEDGGGVLAGLAWLGGLVLRGVDLADGSTRYELLRGLVGSLEARRSGFELSLVFDALLHLESTPDRFVAGTAFDTVNVRRNARNGVGSVTLLGLLDPSWSDDAVHVEAALGTIYSRSAWSVDGRVLSHGLLPGIGFGYTRSQDVIVDESGEARAGPTRQSNFNLALQAIRYDYAMREDGADGSRFQLLWGLLFGRRVTPEGSEWWTPLIGHERRGDARHPTLFWGFLELGD